jgi:hypothetical protein
MFDRRSAAVWPSHSASNWGRLLGGEQEYHWTALTTSLLCTPTSTPLQRMDSAPSIWILIAAYVPDCLLHFVPLSCHVTRAVTIGTRRAVGVIFIPTDASTMRFTNIHLHWGEVN